MTNNAKIFFILVLLEFFIKAVKKTGLFFSKLKPIDIVCMKVYS